ncbi:MAG TPA: hypothetical protein VFD53_09260 [Ilumatobacter sp.]|nr:hypothetical protein [Ilumatobacter sp.]
MGWMSDKQAQAAALIRGVLEPSVPPGETLTGTVYANKKSSFSAKLYALGVTDEHLLIQEVDRKWKPVGAPVIATAGELKVGNIFSDGATWTLSDKDQEIRFEAKGQDYKLLVLGGNMLENALAGSDQVDGLGALVEFLRKAPR